MLSCKVSLFDQKTDIVSRLNCRSGGNALRGKTEQDGTYTMDCCTCNCVAVAVKQSAADDRCIQSLQPQLNHQVRLQVKVVRSIGIRVHV